MKSRFWLWMTGWADIVDGVCRVVTLGQWCPELSIPVIKKYLDCVEIVQHDFGSSVSSD